MNISHMDARLVLAQAVAGFVLAGTFSLGNLLARKKVGDRLNVETKALHFVDEQLCVFLCEIQQQTSDKISFLRLVGCIDRIMESETLAALNRDKIIDPDTRLRSKQEYTRIKMVHMPRLCADFEQTNKSEPKRSLDFQVLLTQVLERLYKHLEKIWILTERSKQNE